MDGELLLFGFIHLSLSVLVLTLSIRIALKKVTRHLRINIILMIVIVLLNALSITFFVQILLGAYPSYIAHLVLSMSLPLLLWQYLNFRKYQQKKTAP